MTDRASDENRQRHIADGLDVSPELLPHLPELLADIPVLGSWPETIVELLRDDAALPPGARVLDLCCGKGPVAVLLALELGFEVLGIDLFPPFVEEATARAAEAGVSQLCRFETGDVRELLDEHRGYDVAILAGVGCGVLGGFTGAVERMRKSVRTGGHLVIDDGFFAHVARLDRPGYEYYRTHEETLRELTLNGDALVREVVIPDEDLASENRRNMEHIRRRAAEIERRHAQNSEALRRFVEREEEECRVLEAHTKAAVWLLRRPSRTSTSPESGMTPRR